MKIKMPRNSFSGHYTVTDEALSAETSSMTHLLSYECFHCWNSILIFICRS